MNVDQLKTFHRVAAAGSFTKAARELFLTQSAVSQQIRALEDEIGGRLFDRSGKKIRLTGEGEVLLTYAERLFDLHEEIETLFGGLKTLEKGKDRRGGHRGHRNLFHARRHQRLSPAVPGDRNRPAGWEIPNRSCA